MIGKETHRILKDQLDSFERIELIDEIVILGKEGGVRRIMMTDIDE